MTSNRVILFTLSRSKAFGQYVQCLMGRGLLTQSSQSKQSYPLCTKSVINELLTRSFSVSAVHYRRSVHIPDGTVKGGDGADRYEPNSPYRESWSRRNQYIYGNLTPGSGIMARKKIKEEDYYDDEEEETLSSTIPLRWKEKNALFGQNDYIDILGDGDIHPADLIRGPEHLKGFKGNEYQRLIREMRMFGPEIARLYPTEFENKMKRMRFLYVKYNQRRGTKK